MPLRYLNRYFALNFEYDDGRITATNDQLEVKYITNYKPKDDITFDKFVLAEFLDDGTYSKIKVVVREKLKDSNVQFEEVELDNVYLYNYVNIIDKKEHDLAIAQLEAKLMRMRIGHYIQQQKTDEKIKDLESKCFRFR